MADEALNSFTSLLDQVPHWIADLEHILHTATHKQQDILVAEQPVPSLTRESSKTSSIKSRRSKKSRQDEPVIPSMSEASLVRPQIPHMTTTDVLRLRQRKRKTLSVCSVGQSRAPTYRSKALVVIYYDGDVQKRFETLVRAVGACRNAIRKGKMGAKVDALTRTGSSSSDGDASSGGEEVNMKFGRLNYKSTRNNGRTFAKANDTEMFDKVDGFLAKAQLLCENGAHQILRDGDCSIELNNARVHLQDAFKLAQAEIPTLQNKAEKAESRRRRSDERKLAENPDSLKPTVNSIKAPDIVTMLTMPTNAKLEVDLEADDETDGTDDENNDFLLPVLPATIGRYRMQTSRLYAQ